MLKEHDLNHEIFSAGASQAKWGLIPSHANTTIGVTEAVEGVRLVKIRNPWGNGEKYTGPWCDECPEWDTVSQDIKDSISFNAKHGDGISFMTVEDYRDNFHRTVVNFDVTDGDWYGDHYLYLNDEDRRNSDGYCANYYGDCVKLTKHEFKLTNTADVAQKVYAAVHTWHRRSYSEDDDDCEFNRRAGII